MSTTILVYGGAFDPPHLGHHELLLGATQQLRPDSVWLLPSHRFAKRQGTRASDSARNEMGRVWMKRIVVDVQMQGLGGVLFKWDDRELSASTPQKTYDTLRALRTELGSGVHLKFLLGGDQVQNLPKWFRFPEVLDLADWILGPRTVTGDPLNAGLQTLLASGVLLPTTDPLKFETRKARERGNRDGGGEFQVLDFKVASVSSTDVREALALGGDDPLQGKVLPEIEEYLLTQGVYATSQRLWKNS